MKAFSNKIVVALIVFMGFYTTSKAQRTTEIGFTGGVVRFYPDLEEKFSRSKNDAFDNGFGFSSGIFIEDHWKSNIHQIVEINYLNFYSDVLLEYNPVGGGGYGDGPNQITWKNFNNASFSYFNVSGGIKYFLNHKVFVYPGIEWARSLSNEIDMNKSTYHLKLAAGVNTSVFDVVIEYNYGLRTQRRIFDPTIPLIGTWRNKYLQLKIQVPLYMLR